MQHFVYIINDGDVAFWFRVKTEMRSHRRQYCLLSPTLSGAIKQRLL